VVVNKVPSTENDNLFWIGEKYSHPAEAVDSQKHRKSGFRKSIVPTKPIFQFGLHVHGACDLGYPYNGCTGKTSGVCTDTIDKNKSKRFVETKEETYSRNTHRFIDAVTDKEIKDINMKTDAVLYHIQAFRTHNEVDESVNITKLNEYAEFYYPAVVAALRKRQLDLLIDIPSTKFREMSIASTWPPFQSVYESRTKNGTLKL
jgi:hypothetical protein